MKDYEFEIEKLFNLVSLLRTELSAHEENCDKTRMDFEKELGDLSNTCDYNNMSANEIILNLKNKILSLTQDVEYNYISSEEIMNEKFEKLNNTIDYIQTRVNYIIKFHENAIGQICNRLKKIESYYLESSEKDDHQ